MDTRSGRERKFKDAARRCDWSEDEYAFEFFRNMRIWKVRRTRAVLDADVPEKQQSQDTVAYATNLWMASQRGRGC